MLIREEDKVARELMFANSEDPSLAVVAPCRRASTTLGGHLDTFLQLLHRREHDWYRNRPYKCENRVEEMLEKIVANVRFEFPGLGGGASEQLTLKQRRRRAGTFAFARPSDYSCDDNSEDDDPSAARQHDCSEWGRCLMLELVRDTYGRPSQANRVGTHVSTFISEITPLTFPELVESAQKWIGVVMQDRFRFNWTGWERLTFVRASHLHVWNWLWFVTCFGHC